MKGPFDKIKLSHIYTLCIELAVAELMLTSNIKRRYLENAFSFDETISFLEDLKIVKIKSNELFLLKNFYHTHDSLDGFKKKFLQVLFLAKGEVANHLRIFLLNFQTVNNKTFFKAKEIEKIKFSDIRNLLLELEFITASHDNKTYYVNPNYLYLYIKLFRKRKLSPESLKIKQAANASIGLSAEMAIIEFEVKRLNNISLRPKEIEHTSLKNVLAGYDIISFENYLDINSKRINRYIEVKAVSVRDYKFYWSKTEMEIAKVLGDKYYIYLLPIVASNTFDTEKLLIVNNPLKNIYSNVLEWDKEEESLSFSKAQLNNYDKKHLNNQYFI